jgi:hypothetical protein
VIPDAIRKILGTSWPKILTTWGDAPMEGYVNGAFYNAESMKYGLVYSEANNFTQFSLGFDASRVGPTALDNHPASVSVSVYISY